MDAKSSSLVRGHHPKRGTMAGCLEAPTPQALSSRHRDSEEICTVAQRRGFSDERCFSPLIKAEANQGRSQLSARSNAHVTEFADQVTPSIHRPPQQSTQS
jgi:hypothetical protein